MEDRERLAADLAELPRLYAEMEYLMGPVATGPTQRVSGTRSTDRVFDEAAAAARSAVVGVLASWAGVAVETYGSPLPERRVPELAAFLARHLDLLAGHPAAADMAGEIAQVTDGARRIVRPDGVRRVRVGACVRDGCGSEVVVTTGGSDGRAREVRCRAGHVWQPHEWLDLRGRMAAGQPARDARRTLPTRLAAVAVGVSEATVRKWASRGKLTRHGTATRAEYDLEELTLLAAG
ncbi:hypothetical protein [Streptomyces sp. DH12]|uniref:hypothetical protein n=1 Tax=Streptomyces sp. DH12 TaxID=2857010 RepID=UPI001E54DCB6|nr:hypothetical protein [Streptomyces sp. DH12]